MKILMEILHQASPNILDDVDDVDCDETIATLAQISESFKKTNIFKVTAPTSNSLNDAMKCYNIPKSILDFQVGANISIDMQEYDEYCNDPEWKKEIKWHLARTVADIIINSKSTNFSQIRDDVNDCIRVKTSYFVFSEEDMVGLIKLIASRG